MSGRLRDSLLKMISAGKCSLRATTGLLCGTH
jgi:hypothetical protein